MYISKQADGSGLNDRVLALQTWKMLKKSCIQAFGELLGSNGLKSLLDSPKGSGMLLLGRGGTLLKGTRLFGINYTND